MEDAEKRNLIYKQNKKILNQLQIVEKKIETLEENKIHTENQLCDPVILKDSKKIKSLMIDLKKYNHELIALTKTREELNLKIKY